LLFDKLYSRPGNRSDAVADIRSPGDAWGQVQCRSRRLRGRRDEAPCRNGRARTYAALVAGL